MNRRPARAAPPGRSVNIEIYDFIECPADRTAQSTASVPST